MKSILIISVNYKDQIPTASFVKSIENCDHLNQVKLLLVDNKTTQSSQDELNELKKKSRIIIEIIPSKLNRYYWGGVAYALEKVEVEKFEWIIICNNDIEFNDPLFFNRLNDLDRANHVVIGPRVTSLYSGEDLNPFLSNPISKIQDIYYNLYYWSATTAKFIHKIGHLLNRKLVVRKESKAEFLSHHPSSIIPQIYAPHGSCIIFSNEFFIKGGYLDTGFTMYGEEISTAEIAKSLNLPIHYLPSLSLVHNDHQSTGQSSWNDNYQHSKETFYYLKKKYRN